MNMPALSLGSVVRRTTKIVVIVIGLLAIFAAGNYGCLRYHYPHGFSHSCLKQLWVGLRAYAERHDGRFPAGESCPEASLSLLYRDNPELGANILCGKTVPLERTKSVLERGELLDVESCDWHYVEGLTLYDDPELALVWDKIGLDHNGGRLRGGGHSVLRLDGSENIVPESQWAQFLQRQEQLMAARTEAARKGLPALLERVRLPSGEIVDDYDGSFLLEERYCEFGGSRGSAEHRGPKLAPSDLCLRRLPLNEGVLALKLSLNDWESEPVEVQISAGRATPDSILFELQTQPTKPLSWPQSP